MPPILQDFPISQFEDGSITVVMTPPVPVGGRNIQFQVTRRFGSPTPLILKSMASGFYGVSGMNIVNSGAGLVSVAINSVDTSGMDPGAYSYTVQFLDTPRGEAAAGYLLLNP